MMAKMIRTKWYIYLFDTSPTACSGVLSPSRDMSVKFPIVSPIVTFFEGHVIWNVFLRFRFNHNIRLTMWMDWYESEGHVRRAINEV